MTEAVVKGTFIEVVPVEEPSKEQPSVGRSWSSNDKLRFVGGVPSALYVLTGNGWKSKRGPSECDVQGVAEHEEEDEEAEEDEEEEDEAGEHVEELEDGFDAERLRDRRRTRSTTESSDNSAVMGVMRCTSSRSTCISGEDFDVGSKLASPAVDGRPMLMAAAMAAKRQRDRLAPPVGTHTPPLEKGMPTVCVSKTFIEVHTPEPASSGDEAQPSAIRSKTSGEVKNLLAASSSSLPLYVDDGTCWRKATTTSLPECADDGEEAEEEEDDVEGIQQSLWRTQTSSSGAWEAVQERTTHENSLRYFDALQEEHDLDAAMMVAEAVGGDAQPSAIWRSVTSDSAGWEALQDQLRGFGGDAPEAPAGGERRKMAQVSPHAEVCTFHVEDDHDAEDSEDELHHGRGRAVTDTAFWAAADDAEEPMGHAHSEPAAARPKLTAAQRTNRRRAEKRRQRRVAAEAESEAPPAAAALASPAPQEAEPAADAFTTVTLRNLPSQYTRAMLLQLLDSAGFFGKYDFVYLPLDFQTYSPLGFAFVNFREHADALRCFDAFRGFRVWAVPSARECVVVWCAANQQGLASNIERYRNTSLMNASVAETRKPLILVDGLPAPFPPPTRRSWRSPAAAPSQQPRRGR